MMTTARSLAAATVTTVLLAGCATASGAPPPAVTARHSRATLAPQSTPLESGYRPL